MFEKYECAFLAQWSKMTYFIFSSSMSSPFLFNISSDIKVKNTFIFVTNQKRGKSSDVRTYKTSCFCRLYHIWV